MATQNATEEPPKRFLIPVKKGWKLWIPPVIAALYFVFVVTIASLGVDLGLPDQFMILALGGLGLFVIVILWELLLMIRVKDRKAMKAAAAAAAPTQEEAPVQAHAEEPLDLDAEDFPLESEAPAATGGASFTGAADDIELVVTNGEQKGRRVLELSVPPKTRNPGAIYSKAFVAIDDQYVLRVEDLVADGNDFS